MKNAFNETLRAQHRGFLTLITLAAVGLALPAAQFVWYLARGGLFHFGHEWGSLIFLALPLLGLTILITQYRRHRAAHDDYAKSIQASLRALLDENRLARARIKTIAVLNLAMLLIIPLIVTQLRAVGKAGDEILFPAFVLLPVIVAIVLISMRLQYLRKLQPRQRELESLLAAYDYEPQPGR